jgi:hypothetical protein
MGPPATTGQNDAVEGGVRGGRTHCSASDSAKFNLAF